jgi:site-specific DNA-methyltransferase (adenine-specific)
MNNNHLLNTTHLGDCLDILKDIPDNSIDMVLCDLPYQMTASQWDKEIPLDKLWNQYNRVAKENAAFVLFGSQPFTSRLVMSNYDNFRYEIIWVKHQATNPMFAKKGVLKCHENISVFYRKLPTYNPQIEYDNPYSGFKSRIGKKIGEAYNNLDSTHRDNPTGERYPVSFLYYANPSKGKTHPNEKPLDLIRYLVRTFSNEGDLVLDNCAGSFVTGEACVKENRYYLLMEKDTNYFSLGNFKLANLQTER